MTESVAGVILAAIFLLADQPHVPVELVRALVERHTQTQSAVVMLMIVGKRANPALFDHIVFPDLMTLQGDTGRRLVFSHHPVAHAAWNDPSLLLDVDTLEDDERLLALGP